MSEWILFLIFLIAGHVLFYCCYITGKTNLILLVSFTSVACSTAHSWRCVQVGWRCGYSSFTRTYDIICNQLKLTTVRKHPTVPTTHLKVWVPICCAPNCHSGRLCRLLTVLMERLVCPASLGRGYDALGRLAAPKQVCTVVSSPWLSTLLSHPEILQGNGSLSGFRISGIKTSNSTTIETWFSFLLML